MKQIYKLLILSAITLVLVLSCAQEPTNVTSSENSTEPQDSTTQEINPQEIKILPLPDTTYPSVENITYNITIMDTTTSGELSNYDDVYENTNGIYTFRGNSLRNAPYCGHIEKRPTDIDVEWTFTTDVDLTKTDYGTWGGGSGWTGQPLYVEWNDSLMQLFKQSSDSLTENFGNKEIIVGSLCGKMYFINYETGKASRKPINVFNPIKGTAMLDPYLNGNLYVGQGVPKERPFGALVIDLFEHKISHTFPQDGNAWRNWGAYDASPLVVGDFLIRIGENGTVYKFKREKGKITLHSTLRYRKNGDSAGGMESSMAVYRNYGYTTDNHGNILCINLNNLKPVWYYCNHDDTDASPVIEIENGTPYLYSGCEMDRQGNEGISYIVKLNALTGELIWEQKINCKKMTIAEKHFDGGMYSTMLSGRGNCSDLIFTNICTNNPPSAGNFYAIRKETGEIEYTKKLKHYAWSSPISILNDDGEMFILNCDCIGNVYIIDGKTGDFLITKEIGLNFESSPIIIGDNVVVGSRGSDIYKLKIR